jgi:arginase
MDRLIAYAGVPTSHGSYAPGQEKAPKEFRQVGFPEMLLDRGLGVVDYGDLSERRWYPDHLHPFAQHWQSVITCVQETDVHLSEAFKKGQIPVVVGGNCTIELGVVVAALRKTKKLGLIYLDLHADMNTPETTTEGGLDWMGMAHMLGLNGAIPKLASCGSRYPLLSPNQVHFVGFDPESATNSERETIRERRMEVLGFTEVNDFPVKCAETILSKWAAQFEQLLVHFDVDVVNFNDLPLAENYTKNRGLRYGQTLEFLNVVLKSPKFGGLTMSEINPDHGAPDGSTLRTLAQDISDLLAHSLNPA